MLLLSASRLSYDLPDRPLLVDVGLTLEKGEKVGLVGRNGSGKSTLLRLLWGQLAPAHGEVTVRSQVTVRLLEQLPELNEPEEATLREVVSRGCPELLKLHQDYHHVCSALERSSNPELERRLNALTDQLTLHQAWDLETRAGSLLTTLGFADPERPLRGLSGGELKRVALARTLLVPPDVLLLDEPTNHLDIASIAWLEKYLQASSLTLLMITHDRFFLERVCTRLLEVSQGSVTSFAGNYSSYLEQKAAREATQQRQQERFDALLRREQAWLRQGPRARATKQKARQERARDLLEQGSGLPSAETSFEEASWNLGRRRLGQKVIALHQVHARSLRGVDFRLEPGECVGLVGANGSGKTTFLDLLAGRLAPEHGRVERGETVHLAYFDQHTRALQHLPSETRALEAVREVATSVQLEDGKEISAARLSEMFLFRGSQQGTPIGKLSGGERKRLEFLRLLMGRPNVLLLDEPTNDLDLETLQRLESFLETFSGSLCLASHDRFLLQRLCDRLLIFRGGAIEEALPEVLDGLEPGFFDPVAAAAPRPLAPSPSLAPPSRPRKLSYKQTQELLLLEQRIPDLERQLEELDRLLVAQSTDYAEVQRLSEEKACRQQQLDTDLERWTELEELRESIDHKA